MCIKTLGGVLKRVWDAKMAIMAMTIDKVNRMHGDFIFFGINDIWKTKKNLELFGLFVGCVYGSEREMVKGIQ